MATVKRGVLITSPEWWKHLRWTKTLFWSRHRVAERKEIDYELETMNDTPGWYPPWESYYDCDSDWYDWYEYNMER
jgi:hypothetical protein